jgi:predicted RNA-binding Zn-ribbon protein involved in translation (DUF1610 family)
VNRGPGDADRTLTVVLRLYWNNDSFPELREVHPQWARTVTWWRAIRHGSRHADFWGFLGLQAAIAIGCLLADRVAISLIRPPAAGAAAVHTALLVVAVVVISYLQVSLGGDMMRRHLRSVSETARHACPACGQSLFGHLQGAGSTVRCPECAAEIDRRLFEPPYRVPKPYRLFPPWR